MAINNENIYLGSDEEEVSDVTGMSEGNEEYDMDKLSASSFRHLSFDLAPTSASNEENKSETSSGNISTDVPSFRSSSSLNSTLAPASWPSDMSDIYLQTSDGFTDNSSCPKSNTSSLEIDVLANSPEWFSRSLERISKPKVLPNKPADKKRNIVKSKKSVKHPFLYDILGGALVQIPSTKVHYLENLKVSISKLGSHLGSQGLSLPEDSFAGYFTLNIEDTTDGMFIESNMNFKEDSFTIDVKMFSKLTKDFKLIEEKRTESRCNDYEHKEKSLHVFVEYDNFIAYRTNNDGGHEKKYRGCISLKCQTDFALDGSIFALMRLLIATKYSGSFQCYSMSISGRLLRQVFSISEKEFIQINQHTIEVRRMTRSTHEYATGREIDASETLFFPTGGMVYHTWANSRYIVHIDPMLLAHQQKLNPCMELTWKSDSILNTMFQFETEKSHCSLHKYLDSYPEVIELLNDYMIALFQRKPNSVVKFTCDFFEHV